MKIRLPVGAASADTLVGARGQRASATGSASGQEGNLHVQAGVGVNVPTGDCRDGDVVNLWRDCPATNACGAVTGRNPEPGEPPVSANVRDNYELHTEKRFRGDAASFCPAIPLRVPGMQAAAQ